jgi:hypothetical protein
LFQDPICNIFLYPFGLIFLEALFSSAHKIM